MDGGAADAIPYERALERGCERVIVVLTRERSYVRRPEKLQPLIDAAYRQVPQVLRYHAPPGGRLQHLPGAAVSA